jgi:hypothetical protein
MLTPTRRGGYSPARCSSRSPGPIAMTRPRVRHVVVAVIPATVPLTMAMVFAVLRRYVTAPTAYNMGFAIYWFGWCLAVPLWLLGPRNAARLLTTGRRLPRSHVALLAMPVAGAIGTQLIPRRSEVDRPTAAIMVGPERLQSRTMCGDVANAVRQHHFGRPDGCTWDGEYRKVPQKAPSDPDRSCISGVAGRK